MPHDREFPRPFVRTAVHVHSEFSPDAWESVPNIMQAAQEAGLDAVLLTDHDSMEACQAGFDRWFGDTALVVGSELSTPGNHYLAFGTGLPVPAGLAGQHLVRAVAEKGGIGFWAHPISKGSPLLPGVEHPWESTDARGFTGIELWTYLESWAASVTTIPRAIRFFQHPELAVHGPHPEAVRLWDRLCQEQAVVAIAGLDAHAYRVQRELERLGLPLPVGIDLTDAQLFPYSHMFGTLRTNVYMEHSGERATSMNYDAFVTRLIHQLGGGACFCSYDVLGDPAGFDFAITTGREVLLQGMSVAAGSEDATAVVSIPGQEAQGSMSIRLVHNGEVVRGEQVVPGQTWRADNLPVSGVYRAVIDVTGRRRRQPWIYSNPIYLRSDSGR